MSAWPGLARPCPSRRSAVWAALRTYSLLYLGKRRGGVILQKLRQTQNIDAPTLAWQRVFRPRIPFYCVAGDSPFQTFKHSKLLGFPALRYRYSRSLRVLASGSQGSARSGMASSRYVSICTPAARFHPQPPCHRAACSRVNSKVLALLSYTSYGCVYHGPSSFFPSTINSSRLLSSLRCPRRHRLLAYRNTNSPVATMKLSLFSTAALLLATVGSAATVSKDATCGGVNGYTCKGSAFDNCCSASGWCGSSAAYCGSNAG